MGDIEKALKFTENRELLTDLYMLIGCCHKQLDHSEKALVSFTKALEMIDDNTSKDKMLQLTLSLADIYAQIGQTEKASQSLKEAWELLSNIDTSQSYRVKIPETYLQMAELATALSETALAETVLLAGLKAYNLSKAPCKEDSQLAKMLMHLVNLYAETDRYDEIDQILDNADGEMTAIACHAGLQLFANLLKVYSNQNNTAQLNTLMDKIANGE